ncbi:unnamed protein product [Diplocarpon coronariae]
MAHTSTQPTTPSRPPVAQPAASTLRLRLPVTFQSRLAPLPEPKSGAEPISRSQPRREALNGLLVVPRNRGGVLYRYTAEAPHARPTQLAQRVSAALVQANKRRKWAPLPAASDGPRLAG